MIYPLTVDQMICGLYPSYKIDDVLFKDLFTPFIINSEFLTDCQIEFEGSMLDFFFSDHDSLLLLVNAIAVFAKTQDISINMEQHAIKVADFEGCIDNSNFDEFADIILKVNCMGRYEHKEEKIPHFETQEGYERWKKLQERRKKYSVEDDIKIENCGSFIQLHSQSYIPDEEILGWTYWKFNHYYGGLVRKVNYEELFKCFATFGGGDLKKDVEKAKTDMYTKL